VGHEDNTKRAINEAIDALRHEISIGASWSARSPIAWRRRSKCGTPIYACLPLKPPLIIGGRAICLGLCLSPSPWPHYAAARDRVRRSQVM
jgi:hypothetical protein